MGTMKYLGLKLDEAVEQARVAAEQARTRAGEFAGQHSQQADTVFRRATTFVNERTEGRYAGPLDRATKVAQTGWQRAAGVRPGFEGWGTPMRGGTRTDGTPMSGPAR
ncbi:antitoxin [Paenibacillus sp. TRM 82003]|uniref:antitoxin n=1 Tax=Kineococcus sp. TRM81007 TaxID=2925831 RepID=UPI001F59688C|nr:antitoxin [Kineococcus sp. TRM81007]MCI2240323.1 antitoxin [Kineococcus sp. TRM81007]MCI3927500.1 antitoxin [Paenibacillus sp. TRM 82003]